MFAQYHNSLDRYSANYKDMYDNVRVLAFTEFPATHCYVMFFNFTGLMLIGSLFYNKAPFIKTSLLICAVVLAAFLFNYFMVKLLINNTQSAFPLNFTWIWVGKRTGNDSVCHQELQNVISTVFRYILPLCCRAFHCLRLKEKEF